ncbi:MAG: S8 family serine peptidase [Verrucomicrobiaceae bacterium]
MQKFSVAFAVLLGCGLGIAQQMAPDASLKTAYDITVGGMKRRLNVVTGELAVKQPDGRRVIEKTAAGDLVREVKALRVRTAPASEVQLVLTEANDDPKSRNRPVERHFVTREVLVKLKAGVAAQTLAQKAGLKITRQPGYAPGFVVLDAGTAENALGAMEALRALPEVDGADVLLATQKAKKFTPNDPLFSEQWHLLNTTQLGGALWVDTNITSAWDTAKGTGITIGIIDDGVEHTHPDIQPGYNTAIDHDYNGNDDDPFPGSLTDDIHGTSCTGVAGARGNNGIGVSGAAPEATLTGFRLIAAANTDQDEADAFNAHNDVIHIKSNSWGTPDGGGYGGMGPLAQAALENGVTTGRGGKGEIYVFAGGNGFDLADNSNYDAYSNSPYVIAVGAVNDFGFQSYYSEPGANLLVAAPSSGGGHNEGIRTTDVTGEGGYNNTAAGASNLSDRNYTNDFGGTSSACPLVSGIVALMLQANPNLGWRDVQEILIRTARKVHQTDPEWAANAAGLSFNHKYGAGLIDAAAAVALAQQWTNLPAMSTTQVAQTGIGASIPDNSSTGVTRTLNFSTANFRVEHVAVTVNATHAARGDLEVTLTSPSGMTSKLAQSYSDGTDNLDWTYTSVRHWGESAAGNWTVKVADRVQADTGILNSVTIKLYGTVQAGARIAGASIALTSEGNTPANSTADPGEAVTFNLGLKNIGGTNTSSLTATLLAIGGVSSPSAPQNFGALTAGGATVTQSFSFKPSGGCGISVPLVLKLQDGATDLGFANLNIPLGTSASSTFTGGAITIRDNNTASPSPSNLSVSGLVGRVQDMTAQFTGFSHTYVSDVGALLHCPDALKIRLFCGGTSGTASSVNITFDDNAALIFPQFGNVATSSYRPWDYYGPYNATSNPSGRSFTGDTAVELAYTMSEFRGVPANGTWKLYMQDFAPGDFGSMTGWKLFFTTVTCTDNVMLTQSATSGGEAAGSILVSVTRTGGKEGSATINYATSNGTAASSSDYTSASGTLTFAAGELVKTFAIPITNDITQESDETIQVTLSSAGGNATLGTLATGTVTILDNDAPTPVALSPATQNVTEAATSLTFTVSRVTTGNPGTVSWFTTAGTASTADYQSGSGTVSFAASDLSQTFAVQILNDGIPEDPESFTVSIQSPTGGLSLGSPTTVSVTIIDGDTDADSMIDDYETSNGLNPAVNDAALDLDGDGISNFDEFIAGSAPNSGTSQFRGATARSGNDVQVSFPTLTGRTYKVEASQTLVAPWDTLQSGIAGTGSTVTIPDAGAALLPKKFYRIIVTKP